jgi:hypothetical protein
LIPHGMKYKDEESRCYLASEKEFIVDEIEVY